MNIYRRVVIGCSTVCSTEIETGWRKDGRKIILRFQKYKTLFDFREKV